MRLQPGCAQIGFPRPTLIVVVHKDSLSNFETAANYGANIDATECFQDAARKGVLTRTCISLVDSFFRRPWESLQRAIRNSSPRPKRIAKNTLGVRGSRV
jgi:hypothetical protein